MSYASLAQSAVDWAPVQSWLCIIPTHVGMAQIIVPSLFLCNEPPAWSGGSGEFISKPRIVKPFSNKRATS